VVIDSEQLKVLLIEMLQEAGVKVLTHALAARPIMGETTVDGAFIETKTGRHAVLADVVVDTTGEADLAVQSGCPIRWSGGSASVEFKMGRVDLNALYEHFREHPDTFPVGRDMVKGFAEFERNWVERGILFFPHGGGKEWDIFQRAIERGEYEREKGILYSLDAAGLYGLRGQDTVIVNSNFWEVDSLAPEDVSRAELAAQAVCPYIAEFFREHVPGFERGYIVQIASDMGIRTSRGIEGTATLTSGHVYSDRPVRFADTVGCAPAQSRYVETGQFFHSHTFDIPYGILVPKEVDDLLVGSGKSVSCEPQGLVRGMSTCMLVGQAAGTAAALCAREGVAPRRLSTKQLQRTLMEQDAYLGSDERLAELGLG
jgi:hypothetical protein